MSNKLDIEDIKEKVAEKLKPSGWDRILRGFIYSKEFDDIIITLAKQSKDGKRFTPVLKNWFRAFEECPYEDLKVIIVGQDPYPGLNHADGIAFSLSNSDTIQPSLEYMFKAINDTVYDGMGVCTDMNLKRWSNQGVLLLNTALTTVIGKVGQHHIVWQPFMAYLFDWLTWNNNGLVYIYLGKKAEEWSHAVNDNNYKLFATHPASALYNNLTDWDSNNVFKTANEILKKNYNTEINW